MGLRINHNIAAVNGHRMLAKNDAMVSKSLEKLSSGLRINKAADDAAGLVISEQMRAQITGQNQAIANSENAVSMVQTAEGALDETNSLLNKARSLALHAGNEGANDQNQLVADQTELDNIVSSVDRIGATTQFGTKNLLDGSVSSFKSANSNVVGATQTGNDYATKIASGTYVKGYHSIRVTAQATQGSMVLQSDSSAATAAAFCGMTSNASSGIDAMSGTTVFNKSFTIAVQGTNITVNSGQTKNDLVSAINAIGKSAGFTAVITCGGAGAQAGQITGTNAGTGVIQLINNKYGDSSSITFSFVSGFSGATGLSGTYTAGTNMTADLLMNTGAVGAVAGSGSVAVALTATGSNGLTLVSAAGTGFKVDLKSALTISGGNTTGGTYFGVIDGSGSGATFQIGANAGQTATVEMASAKASDLGTGASSTYRSLNDLKGSSLVSGNAQEALKVIDKAISDVSTARGKLGAFQANTLETNLNSLQVAQQNTTAAESTIRDVDFAAESSNFTKNNILVQSATAMLAQANQLPQQVLKLLG